MKKYISIISLLTLIACLSSSCDNSEEVPPRTNSFVKPYVMPKAKPLTEEDRTEIEQRQQEYDNSL